MTALRVLTLRNYGAKAAVFLLVASVANACMTEPACGCSPPDPLVGTYSRDREVPFRDGDGVWHPVLG